VFVEWKEKNKNYISAAEMRAVKTLDSLWCNKQRIIILYSGGELYCDELEKAYSLIKMV